MSVNQPLTDSEARNIFINGAEDFYSLSANPQFSNSAELFDAWLTEHDRQLLAKTEAEAGKRISSELKLEHASDAHAPNRTIPRIHSRMQGREKPARGRHPRLDARTRDAMSFTEKKFVAIHCDECDEQYEPEDGSAYYTDKDDADDDVSSDGWQLDGDENHYCPQHWHLTCSKCGKTAMGNHDELIENGWDCATDEWLCPECH